jgi:tetratricopeptide (TPR) repeat protein
LIEATMAERFVYTPSLGFCILIGAVVAKYIVNEKSSIQTFTLTQLNKNAKIVYPFIVICVLFIGRTVVRAANWKDNITLLQKDVQSAPESARIRYALGSALLIEKAMKEENGVAKNNYLDMAIDHLTKGVTLIPNYNDAWYHLGLAYKEKEDYPNAVAALEQANSYKKFEDVNRIISLGTTYGLNRQYSKAIPLLKEALAKDSSSSDAWNNIGLYYGESGNLDSSMLAFANALKINANFEKAYYNRGNIWAKNGNFKQAIQEYAQAIKINPEFEDAYNNTGNCYGALQLPDSAKKYFEKTIALNPNNGKALYNLGITMKILNDSVASESYFTRAKNLNVGQ